MSDILPETLTRRTLVFAAAAGAAAVMGVGMAQAGSLPQTAVGYEAKSTHDGKACGACKFFQPPNGCKSVAGEISPGGYCKLWAAKSA